MTDYLEMDLLQFFEGKPQELALFQVFQERLINRLEPLGELNIKVQKTQITYYNRHNFAAIWSPKRKIKGKKGAYIIVTIGLSYPLQSPRVAEKTEAYPNRWTHHIIIEHQEEIDEELLDWFVKAYIFSQNK